MLVCHFHISQANDTGVVLVGTITNPTGQSSGYFGSAIDSVDGTLLVAGAYKNDVGSVFRAGDAYLFAVDPLGSTLDQTCALTHTDPTFTASFGASVAVAGSWLVISTPSYDGVLRQDAVDLYKVRARACVCIRGIGFCCPFLF